MVIPSALTLPDLISLSLSLFLNKSSFSHTIRISTSFIQQNPFFGEKTLKVGQKLALWKSILIVSSFDDSSSNQILTPFNLSKTLWVFLGVSHFLPHTNDSAPNCLVKLRSRHCILHSLDFFDPLENLNDRPPLILDMGN